MGKFKKGDRVVCTSIVLLEGETLVPDYGAQYKVIKEVGVFPNPEWLQVRRENEHVRHFKEGHFTLLEPPPVSDQGAEEYDEVLADQEAYRVLAGGEQ